MTSYTNFRNQCIFYRQLLINTVRYKVPESSFCKDVTIVLLNTCATGGQLEHNYVSMWSTVIWQKAANLIFCYIGTRRWLVQPLLYCAVKNGVFATYIWYLKSRTVRTRSSQQLRLLDPQISFHLTDRFIFCIQLWNHPWILFANLVITHTYAWIFLFFHLLSSHQRIWFRFVSHERCCTVPY